MDPLGAVFGTITQAEQVLVPVFIHNPQSQRIAGIVFLGEQLVFGLLQQLHPGVASALAPQQQPPAPAPQQQAQAPAAQQPPGVTITVP